MSLSGAQSQTSSIVRTTSHTDAAGNVASVRKRENAVCLKQLQNVGSFSDVWQINLRRYQQQGLASLMQLWSLAKAGRNLSLLQMHHFYGERWYQSSWFPFGPLLHLVSMDSCALFRWMLHFITPQIHALHGLEIQFEAKLIKVENMRDAYSIWELL